VSGSDQPYRAPVYKNSWDALVQIVKQRPVALFKGLVPFSFYTFLNGFGKTYFFTKFEYKYQYRLNSLYQKTIFSYYFYTSMMIGMCFVINAFFNFLNFKQIDMITQPLSVMYSIRVISPWKFEFKRFKNYKQMFTYLYSDNHFFRGGSALLLQNLVFAFTMTFLHPTEPSNNLYLRLFIST
jgi:hypothetical protein